MFVYEPYNGVVVCEEHPNGIDIHPNGIDVHPNGIDIYPNGIDILHTDR